MFAALKRIHSTVSSKTHGIPARFVCLPTFGCRIQAHPVLLSPVVVDVRCIVCLIDYGYCRTQAQ